MIRPPPLQLKLDNRIPHPLRTPSQPKSKKSFVAQLYKANWKNVIIALAGLNGLRYAFRCYTSSGDSVVDEEEGAHHLFLVSLALCAIYVISFFIELYGIISVSIQKLKLVRVYLYLTFFASLLITVAGILKCVTYYTLADELITECVTLAIEGRGWQKSFFRGRPWPNTAVPYPEKLAEKQCIYAWTHHSWNHIAAFFLFHLIPALVQYILVYTYYRQTIDPMHHANLLDERFTAGVPSPSFRRTVRGGYSRIETNDHDGMTTARLHHGPTGALTPRQRRAAQQAPYSKRMTTSNENYIGSNNMSIAPEANPGLKAKRPFVSCGIQRSHRPPPLISSPSPLGLNSTPGAPTYNRRPSRVYAAFAAPVASAEYDKFV